MDLQLQKLHTKLQRIETQLDKCRTTCKVDGWQTQRHAKKSRKWDYYAELKHKTRSEIFELEEKIKQYKQ